jgi:glycosyltransferase involved in cell wall biosynthesis
VRLAFLVNGRRDSAIGYRARAFADELRSAFAIEIAYRHDRSLGSVMRFYRFLKDKRPRLVYVLDMGYSAISAAAVYKARHRVPVVVDAGDAIYALMRSSGGRGPLGLALTRCLEEFSLRLADGIVVRGTFHQEHLRGRKIASTVVQDGVDSAVFRPGDVPELRRRLGVEGGPTLGVVGTSVWRETLQMAYGWELVEVLRELKDTSALGIFVGDGSGIEPLKRLTRAYGIEDRLRFVGRVPMEALPDYLNAMDICLSTQTDNLAGRVRTTGKLPQYMATGRYVLATKVGEAALVLPPEMLVDYRGTKDVEYPRRLAERIRPLLSDVEGRTKAGLANVARAQAHFEYRLLAQRLAVVFARYLQD